MLNVDRSHHLVAVDRAGLDRLRFRLPALKGLAPIGGVLLRHRPRFHDPRPVAAIATAAKSDLAGLAERGPIGLFIAWLVVVAWFALTQVRARSDGRMAVATNEGGPAAA